VSIHWVSSELDGGEVILQKMVQKENKSFEEYESEIKRVEKIALVEGIQTVLNLNYETI
jgi:phosphoribosylglycinamide formyltransferase-1